MKLLREIINELGISRPKLGNIDQRYYPHIQEYINIIKPIMLKNKYAYVSYVIDLNMFGYRKGSYDENNVFIPNKLDDFLIMDWNLKQPLIDIGKIFKYNELNLPTYNYFIIDVRGGVWVGDKFEKVYRNKLPINELGLSKPQFNKDENYEMWKKHISI